MSATRTSDCRKFSPNIFNKSKCSHCFRQREEHSAAALECNRASRKVSKCGYLFVAPDWDFSNPLYRTKRWQRRWFVLYDDGELTYSVDEHPETVPQACIDMTKVLEVTTAEDVTGHTNSIAITAPDRVTFVKGTCPEESKWWLNILAAFPKSKGRHKRNATFPGGQATTILQTNSDAVTSGTTRNRHNSYHKDALTSAQSTGVLIGSGGVGSKDDSVWSNEHTVKAVTPPKGGGGGDVDDDVVHDDDDDEVEDDDDEVDDEEDDGVETGEDEDDENVDDVNVVDKKKIKPTATISGGGNGSVGGGQDENNRNAGNEITNRVSPSSCLLIEDIRRDEKTIKDIANTITNLSQQQKSRWSTTAVNNVLNSQLHHHSNNNNNNNINSSSNISQNDKNSRDETDFQRVPISTQQQQTTIVTLRPKSLPLASSSTPAIVSAIVKKIPPVLVSSASTTTTTATNNSGDNNNNRSSNSSGGNSNFRCKSSPRLQLQLKHLQQKHQSNSRQQKQLQQQQQQHQHHHQQHHHERGDPDGGCNLDDLSTNYLAKTAELRGVQVPVVEESLNSKKGWLMKQDNRTGDWTKHWFTLSGAALFFYRDPVSEERGVLDGVLDVNSLTNVAEVNTSKNYAFQLTTWDKRRLILASLSPNSRNSWIAVLRNAAGLQTIQANNAIQQSTTTSTTVVEPTNKSGPTTELIIKDNTSDDIKSEIEKDFIKAQRNQELLISGYQESNNNSIIIKSGSNKDLLNNSANNASLKMLTETSPQVIITAATSGSSSTSSSAAKSTTVSPVTPSTPKTAHFSSDEEYRTASEGGRRDSVDWGSPLSPSPPIPLSLLRTKERMRSRTAANCPSLHKRSRSSPPTSRRSTVDSVGSDELPTAIHPVQEELNIDKELQFRLSIAEKERDMLRDEAKEREARMAELLSTLERTEQQLTARIQEMEEARDSLAAQLTEAKRSAEKVIDHLSHECDEGQRKIKDLEDRLSRGIEENETLYKRLRELESCSPSSFHNLNRSKLKRMDSLSDLTHINDIDPYGMERDTLAEEYNELRSRFEKAVNEIKAMKRELKESQNQFDSLEISYASLKQDLERKEIEDRSQLQMMAERIQDLTLKYSGSERQVRTLKQKLAKSERRRSLSLKGKEQLTISKELEIKVTELEAKIDELEKSTLEIRQVAPSNVESGNKHLTRKSSSRRRSLESSIATGDTSLQFMVRVNDLEKRFEGVSATSGSTSSSSTPTPLRGTPTIEGSSANISAPRSTSSPKVSEHLIERMRCLEGVLISSKDRLEQSLQHLQSLRSSRTRRSVSPITDRKDSLRFVERCLAEVVKLIRESCETCVVAGTLNTTTSSGMILLPETSPVKVALIQLEAQLRNKLADLLKQRRVLRERNELTSRKDLELLAERVAFESVCFGKLRDSVSRAEHPEFFGERQTRAEVAETSHLITMLKAKLSGKCAFKPSGSVDILAGVLARRLVLSSYRKEAAQRNKGSEMQPVDQNILDDLLRQQNEINLIAKRYKNNAMENLASGLAAETLSYISSNDLVQGAVQEAWRQAQETVNAELVQSEIAHIMMRSAERFESSITPSFGYTLTAEERLTFENFADAVHDALRKEMELAVAQLSHCYEEAIQTMKRGQWRLHLEQERKASEGRQLLSEFADIIAHKALVDARIAVLCGTTNSTDYRTQEIADSNNSSSLSQLGITALQKYENLFEELSNDLQISNPDDILAEADFEFMYKQHTVDFLNDRQVLSEISSFLGQLEDSLIALQCEAISTTSISRSAISIESLQDVCHKCCDLRQRADQLLRDVQHKLNTPCQHCLQVREKLCDLQQQHESELLRMQQTHAKDMNMLMQQVENQRNALKNLEAERQELTTNLHRQRELVEDRQHEVNAVQKKLKNREDELQCKLNDKLELLERLDEQEEKLSAYQEESDALTMKCARQDEEYAVLLQERDYIQAELNKEKERSRRFEKRLEMLELEHGKQLECLQEAYREQILSHCSDFTNIADEESFRQRYQTEIEQLRTLCEKGLSAMESSHRRIISDLEEKHRQEIDRLLLEKETALAEETQATLAALDAMRKAHQSEVQREVARFKQEFLRQFQKGDNTHDATKFKEEELEELRQEIFSFSEKYSIKCVENAALEEKLRSANQKLKHFQQMQQLELRNKQFRAHLASDDPLTDVAFYQGLTASKEDTACQDSESAKHVPNVQSVSEIKMERPITTASFEVAQLNKTKQLEQSFYVIPSASLLISKQQHQQQKLSCARKEEDEQDNITDNVDYCDSDDRVDDGDAAYDSNRRYSYEPCYKQNNLYSYQNRMSFEGLRSTTFGKKLKTTTKTLKISIPTTTIKTTLPAAITKTTLTATTLGAATASPTSSTTATFKNTATIKLNDDSNDATTAITTNEQINYNYYKQYLQKQQQKSILVALTTTTTPTTTTTNPVEEPKNINFNQNNKNIIINDNNNLINYNNNIYNNLNLKQIEETKEKLKLVNNNSNNNNNNNVNVNKMTATAPMAATATNLKVAEKSAINLESFTAIIKKTVSEPQQQQQQQQQMLNAAVRSLDDVGGGGGGDDVRQQQQQQQYSHSRSTAHNQTTYASSNQTQLLTTTVNVNSSSSPTSLSGSDVEQSYNSDLTVNTSSSSNSNDNNSSITTNSKHLRRFELEI